MTAHASVIPESIQNRKAEFTMDQSFKSRVERFWNWYQEIADRFYQTIDAGRCEDLTDEIVKEVDELFPGLAWVFGPGPSNVGGHSFTLSGEGVRHKQFLTEYWLEQAPEIEGWTFFASRQPAELSSEGGFRIGDAVFSIGDMRFAEEVDEEQEVIHVQLFHPLFESLDENTRLRISFLLLDEALGEYGTEQWIGAIETVTSAPEGSRSFLQLRDVVHDLEIKYRWTKIPPTQSGAVYQLEPSDDRGIYPRHDVVLGSTMHIGLIEEYVGAEGDYENPIPDTGADFVYLEFSSSNLPSGSEAAFRGEIEDAINERLAEEKLGHSIGGAFGRENSYIDFLIMDPAGLEVIRSELMSRNLAGNQAIRYFAKERRGDAIELISNPV